MTRHCLGRIAIGLAAVLAGAGCVVRPEGEDAERERADGAALAFSKPFAERDLTLPAPDATLDDWLRYAWLASPELEEAFFAWRSALERVPQASTQPTTLMLGAEYMLQPGGMSAWDRTTLMAQSDPMASLVWPGKLAAAGREALEQAKAAGLRFDRRRFELRRDVVEAWVDVALARREIDIAERDLQVLELTVAAARARVAGAGPQRELVRARAEAAMVRNEIEELRAREVAARARLLARAGAPRQDLPVKATMPPPSPLPLGDDEVLATVAERNPELRALASEVAGRQEALELARLGYIPDFSLSASITGSVSQLLGAALTVPFLRRTAIEGRIAEAQADLGMLAARRRAVENDVAASAVLELYALRSLERQIDVERRLVLPLAEQAVELARSAYSSGGAMLVELLDARRVSLAAQRTLIRLEAEREKTHASLVALAAVELVP